MSGPALSALAAAPVFPTLGRLALPIMLSLVFGALANAVDMAFISQFSQSDRAIAALSVIFPLQMLVAALGTALGGALASVLTRALGAGKPVTGRKAIWQATVLTIWFGLLLTLGLCVLLPALLALLQTPADVLPIALDYGYPVLLATLPALLAQVWCEVFRAQAKVRLMVLVVVSSCLLNVLLNTLLIVGLDWGVFGAGVATAISQLLAALLAWWLLQGPRNRLQLWCCGAGKAADSGLRWLRRRALPGVKRELLLLGLPLFLNQLGIGLMVAAVNSQLASTGGLSQADVLLATAAFGLFIKMMVIVVMPLQGLAAAFQTLAAFHAGAGDQSRLWRTVYAALGWTLGYAIIVYGLMYLQPQWLYGAFMAPAAVNTAAITITQAACLAFPLYALFFVSAGFFLSTGRAGLALLIYLSHNYLFFLPFVFLFPAWWGDSGIWWAFVATDVAAAALGALCLLLALWRPLPRALSAPQRQAIAPAATEPANPCSDAA
ncbi:MATE family efflux transporter [Rheinheimera texasensis]|uniref:MATE family efflux transporter n=1 Tax=Rheinheimera texasensis TaxID=306205 RepID=UPI0032B2E0AD